MKIFQEKADIKPVYNYRCKKCGSRYINLSKELNYSHCIVTKTLTGDKCNGQLVSF